MYHLHKLGKKIYQNKIFKKLTCWNNNEHIHKNIQNKFWQLKQDTFVVNVTFFILLSNWGHSTMVLRSVQLVNSQRGFWGPSPWLPCLLYSLPDSEGFSTLI